MKKTKENVVLNECFLANVDLRAHFVYLKWYFFALFFFFFLYYYYWQLIPLVCVGLYTKGLKVINMGYSNIQMGNGLKSSNEVSPLSQCSHTKNSWPLIACFEYFYVDIGIDIDAKDYCTGELHSNVHARRTSFCIAKRI